MALADSTLDVAAMARAQALLMGPTQSGNARSLLAAAAVLALTATVFAVMMVVLPPVISHHAALSAPG